MSSLGTLTIDTMLGDTYSFPAVPRTTLEPILKAEPWAVDGPCAFINASGACLSMPGRIIKRMRFDINGQTEHLWART